MFVYELSRRLNKIAFLVFPCLHQGYKRQGWVVIWMYMKININNMHRDHTFMTSTWRRSRGGGNLWTLLSLKNRSFFFTPADRGGGCHFCRCHKGITPYVKRHWWPPLAIYTTGSGCMQGLIVALLFDLSVSVLSLMVKQQSQSVSSFLR